MFTVPNRAITFPFQSRLFESDLQIMAAAAGGKYGAIQDNCEVTASVVPAMTVEVAAGNVVVAGVLVAVAGGTVVIADADALLPRFDVVVAVDDGTLAVLAGTPDAAPFPLSPDDTQTGLAQVFVPALASSITSSNIVDKRVWVLDPIEATGWLLAATATDLTRTNNAALTADPAIAVPVSANGKYRVRGQVVVTQSAGSPLGGFKWGMSGPTGAALLAGQYHYATNNLGTSNSPILLTQLNSQQGSVNLQASGFITITYDFVFRNGSNSGTLAFTWAQNNATSGTSITRVAESYWEYAVA